MSPPNFNYQVALKSGLKSLQDGRLRQAEQHFKFLVDKFPNAEGGYRGLAKVYFEQEDRAASLRVLREGAAALAKAGERTGAIGLLREAVALDPLDLAIHRRLAAALALAGDADAAVMEYQRFVRAALESGDGERARLETAYAREQLRDVPAARDLARWASTSASGPAATSGSRSGSVSSDGDTTARRSWAPAAENGPAPGPGWSALGAWPPASAAPSPASETPATTENPWAVGMPPAGDAWASPPAERGPAPSRSADPWAAPAPPPASPSVPAAERAASPKAEPSFAEADSAFVEAAAARYLATHDPRAAGAALEAARRYIKDGRNDAASDLLLQLIASGVANHDAQRLLVDVVRLLPGKRDVVRAKCQLLVQALLLDGRADLAAEVEALAKE